VRYSVPLREVLTMAKEKEKGAPTKRPTAQKRMIQDAKRAADNRSFRAQVKTALRSYTEAVEGKKPEAAQLLNTVYSLYDKGVKKGVYKTNTVSRSKSRLAAKLAG
jgi:small subunit ribosomal protein S20